MVTGFTNPHNMYRLDRPMKVERVENGVILPQLAIKEEKPMWGLGGVCDKEGKFVELSYYDGNWATHGGGYDFEEAAYCDETVVYFGPFFKHWGHFLIDLVGRAWYLVGKDTEKLKVAYLGDEEPTGNYLQFFELLGVSADRLIRITTPTRFKEVIVPEYSASSCVWYTDEYSSIFEEIAKKVAVQEVETTVPDKVYFSRLGFGKAKQTEVGEEYIEGWLSANGYQSVAPEKLSLIEQVCVWNQAKSIACLDGTIPLNVNFSTNKDLNLLVMHKTSLEHQNLEMSLLMRPCCVTILDAYWEPFKKYPKSIGSGPFLLCISDDVVEYSQKADMVMPFDEKTIKKQRRKSYWGLVKIIVDIKGRTRRLLSKMVPASLKRKLRGR